MMEKRGKASKIILTLFLMIFLFTLLQFLSPIFLPSNTYIEIDGMVGVINNEVEIENMSFPWNIGYLLGDSLCHQKQERSFIINGNQMPFCSRCTAIWLGLTTGLAVMLFYHVKLNSIFMIILILSLFPIGIDGGGQLIGLWESTNISRTLTGLIIGVPVGIALGVIIDEGKVLFKSKTN